ncbi:MAG: hypothetical protein ABR581_12105 [Thermoleophilaceae bacterium]
MSGALRCCCALALVASALLPVAGCGGSDKSANELKRENEIKQARQQGAQAEKLRQLQRELRQQKGNSGSGQGGSTGSTGNNGPVAFKGCDPNVSVNAASTTCPFGENVFYEYWKSGRAGSITVYSPSTRQTYLASCTQTGGEVLCATAQGAGVRFSSASVDAYTQGQADRYAATHDLGP